MAAGGGAFALSLSLLVVDGQVWTEHVNDAHRAVSVLMSVWRIFVGDGEVTERALFAHCFDEFRKVRSGDAVPCGEFAA